MDSESLRAGPPTTSGRIKNERLKFRQEGIKGPEPVRMFAGELVGRRPHRQRGWDMTADSASFDRGSAEPSADQTRLTSVARTLLSLASLTLIALLLFGAGPGARPAAADPIGDVGNVICSTVGGTVGGKLTSCPLAATDVIYVTNWAPPGQTPVTRQFLGVVGLPAPLDVDNRLGPDLVATLRPVLPSLDKVQLEINKTLDASSTLPVAVMAFVNDPKDPAVRLGVGYDALASSAPATFQETFAPRIDGIGVTVATTGAKSADLLGRRVVVDSNGADVETKEARIGFTPLPATITGDVSDKDVSGVKTTVASLTVGTTSKVSVDFSDAKKGQPELRLKGTLDELAGTATATLTQTPVQHAQPANTPEAKIVLAITGPPVAKGSITLTDGQTKADAVLENLPSNPTLTLSPQTATAPQRITIDPKGQSFGLVDVALANGEPRRLTDDQYAYVYDDGTLKSIAARVRGLKDATLEIAGRPAARENDLVHVKATSDGGPFRLLVDEPTKDRRINADIQNLPASVDFTLRPNSTPTIAYRGSAVIGSANITVHDGAGLAKSVKLVVPRIVTVAKDLQLLATNLATDVTVSLEPGAKKITLVATDTKPGDMTPGNPADIGMIEVRLSTGALAGDDKAFVDDLTSTNHDGALVRDRIDRYVIFARISSLHSATLELGQEPLHVNLKHGPQYGAPGGSAKGPLHALVEDHAVTLEPNPETGRLTPVSNAKSIDADVKDLPREIDLKLRKTPTASDPTLKYLGTDVIAQTQVRVHDDAGLIASQKTALPVKDLLITVSQLPTDVTASFAASASGRPTIDVRAVDAATGLASGIDQIDVQLWTRPSSSTNDLLPNADDQRFVTDLGTTTDGALVRDLSSRYVIFARLRGLKEAHLSLDPQLIELRGPIVGRSIPAIHAPGLVHDARPFHAVIAEDLKSVDATINDLPATVTLVLRPKSTPTIEYRGSAAVGSATISVHDEAGVAQNEKTFPAIRPVVNLAKDLQVVATGLPTDVTVSLQPSTKTITLVATDAKPGDRPPLPGQPNPANPADIGMLEVRLSTGALAGDDKAFVDDLTATNRDGALVRDRLDRYVIFARISSLHSATLGLGQEPLHVNLKHGPQYGASGGAARRPLHALIEDQFITGVSFDPMTRRQVIESGMKSVDADVKDLPREIDLNVRKTPTATDPTFKYVGSDVIAQTQIKVYDSGGIAKSQTTGLAAKDLLITLKNLPTTVNATFEGQTLKVCAPTSCSPFGPVEAQLWTGRLNSLDQGYLNGLRQANLDGVLLRDRVDRFVVVARLNSVEQASLTLSKDLIDIGLTHTKGQFGVLVDSQRSDPSSPFGVQNKKVDATIRDLPSTVSFKLRPEGSPTVDYNGSDVITSLTVNVFDTEGVAKSTRTGRVAGVLKINVSDLPTTVKANLNPAGQGIQLDAQGAEIGKVEIQLFDGTSLGTVSQAFINDLTQRNRDGFLLRDVASEYEVFVRINNLHSANIGLPTSGVDIELRTGTQRDMVFKLENAPTNPGSNERIEATVKTRPLCLRLSLAPRGATPTCSTNKGPFTLSGAVAGMKRPQVILYEGSSATAGIDVDVIGLQAIDPAQRKNLFVSLSGVPDRLEAALDEDRQIDLNVLGGKLGTTSFTITNRPPGQTPNSADVLQSGEDGVLIRSKLVRNTNNPLSFDVDRDVIHAFLTGLSSAHIVIKPAIDVTVDADPSPAGRQRFRFDSRRDVVVPDIPACKDGIDNDGDGKVDTQDPGCATLVDDDEESPVTSVPFASVLFEEFATAELRELQPKTTFTKSDITGALEIGYSSSAAIPTGSTPALTFRTNAGVADGFFKSPPTSVGTEFTEVTADPLPQSVSFCFRDKGAACGVDAFGLAKAFKQPDGPTITFRAAASVTGHILVCQKAGTDGICTGDPSSDEYLKFTLTGTKGTLQFTNLGSGFVGVYMDTDVIGTIDVRGGPGVSVNLPAGFQANAFNATIDTGFPQSASWTGSLVCPQGSSVKVFGIDILPLLGFC